MRPIFVFSVPRSGSTWLGQLFDSSPQVTYCYQPLFSYAFKAAVGPHSTPDEMRDFLARVAVTDDPFVRYGMSLEPAHPFAKVEPTHLVIKEVRYLHLIDALRRNLPDARFIVLVRSPLGVLASWRQAPKEFDPSWDFAAEWRGAPSKNAGHPENAYGFDAWLATTLHFLALADAHPGQVRIVEYASLIADPVRAIDDVFAFCGLSLHAQTREFVAASTSRDDGNPYGVFREDRRRDDCWRDALEPDVVAEVVARTAPTPAARFLYDAADALALETS